MRYTVKSRLYSREGPARFYVYERGLWVGCTVMLNLDDQVILQQKKSSAIVVGILMVSYAHAYSEEPPFYNLAGLTEITKKKNLTSF